MLVLIVVILALIVVAVWATSRAQKLEAAKLAAMLPEEREKYLAQKRREEENARVASRERSDRWTYGDLNPVMVCPHCQTKGSIRTKSVERKKGISGGKATAAVLTGGISVLATGLSRKEELTQARCGNCKNIWAF